MLSCRKATELIEKKQITGLSKKEKIQLSMHTKMCKYCHRYDVQSQQLEQYIEAQIMAEPSNGKAPKHELSELKKRINSQLSK